MRRAALLAFVCLCSATASAQQAPPRPQDPAGVSGVRVGSWLSTLSPAERAAEIRRIEAERTRLEAQARTREGGPPVPARQVLPGALQGMIEPALDSGGTVTGSVRRSGTLTPLQGIDVVLYDQDGIWTGLGTSTLADGSYAVGGVPAGTYLVATLGYGPYIDELFRNIPCPWGDCDPGSGEDVIVTEGGLTSGVSFVLDVGGTITGLVSDAVTGLPLESVGVYVWLPSGWRTAWGSTGPDGFFSIPGLTTGTYHPLTWNNLGYVDELYDDIPCPGWGCPSSSGTPVNVTAGVQNAPISIALTQGSSVVGRVSDATSGAPLDGLWVVAHDATGRSTRGASTGPGGSYTISGLPSGVHHLRTSNWAGYVDELYDDILCPRGSCDVGSGDDVTLSAPDPRFGVDFELLQGSVITGTVTAVPGSAPLAGVEVVAYDAEGWETGYSVTDAAGRYTLSGLPAGGHFVKTINTLGYIDEMYDDIPCPGWTCLYSFEGGEWIILGEQDARTGIDFALEPGGALSGTVTVGGTGDPVDGAWVYVYGESLVEAGWAAADDAGHYTVSGLPAGTYYAATANYMSPYVDELYDDIACPNLTCILGSGTGVQVEVGQTHPHVDFALDEGARIRGTVLDQATGAPLSGARLRAHDSRGYSVTSGRVDSGGQFELRGLPTGTYYVKATDPVSIDELYDNRACPGSTCDVTSGTPIDVVLGGIYGGVDFGLARGGSIAGTIVDASAAPVAGVLAAVYDSSERFVGSSASDASGHYVVSGLPSGTYYVRTWVYESGLVEELYDNIPCPGEGCTVTSGSGVAVVAPNRTYGIDFSLDAGGAISGHVTKAVTGEALVALTVRVYDGTGRMVAYDRTDGSGHYVADGLPGGVYYARTAAHYRGYIDEAYGGVPCPRDSCAATSGVGLLVSPGSTLRGVDFALDVGGGFTGMVVDQTTLAPLASVEIEAFDAQGYSLGTYTTYKAGTYTISGLPAGTYRARTSNSQGYADELYDDIACAGGSCSTWHGTDIFVSAGATQAGIDFALGPSGALSGTVTAEYGGAAIPSIYIYVYDHLGRHVGFGWTDAGGGYSVTGLKAGTYHLSTWNSQGYLDELYDNRPCPASNCDPTSGDAVVLASGGTVAGLDFALAPGGRIGGRVTDAATSSPLSSVTVQIYDASGSYTGSGYTDASGHYISGSGLAAGAYYARTFNSLGYVNELYDDRPCPGWCTATNGTPIAVALGSTTTGVDFALAMGGGIRGTVTDSATGDPLGGVSVWVYDSTGSNVESTSTDQSGHYSTSAGLPSGTYYARTDNSLGYTNHLYDGIPCLGWCTETSGTPIAVTAGATTTGIDFALVRGGPHQRENHGRRHRRSPERRLGRCLRLDGVLCGLRVHRRLGSLRHRGRAAGGDVPREDLQRGRLRQRALRRHPLRRVVHGHERDAHRGDPRGHQNRDRLCPHSGRPDRGDGERRRLRGRPSATWPCSSTTRRAPT